MKKYIIISVLVLLIIASFVFFYYRNKPTASISSNKNGTNPVTLPESKNASGDKITINTEKGGLAINNVIKSAKSVIGNNALVKETPDYDIVYVSESQNFVISFFGDNPQKSRSPAEEDFLSSLGISRDQACLLKVSVGVMPVKCRNAAGINFGLSFCPNSKNIPVCSQ